MQRSPIGMSDFESLQGRELTALLPGTNANDSKVECEVRWFQQLPTIKTRDRVMSLAGIVAAP